MKTKILSFLLILSAVGAASARNCNDCGSCDSGYDCSRGEYDRYHLTDTSVTYNKSVNVYTDSRPVSYREVDRGSVRKSRSSDNNEFYVTLRADVNGFTFDNTYATTDPAYAAANGVVDSYSFGGAFGGSISAGTSVGERTRAELEFGTTGSFEDANDMANFSLSSTYLMLNGMYDYESGFYVGGGLGVAIVEAEMLSTLFVNDGTGSENTFSPVGALMAGYTFDIRDFGALDLRYRFSGFQGVDVTRTTQSSGVRYPYEAEMSMVLNHSFSLGLKINF